MGNIELSETTPYIDFHYNNDSSDYTFRFITAADGLKLISKASTDCWLYIGNGTNTAGIYWQTFDGGIYMNDSKWLRTYGSKPVLVDIGTNNTWGIGGHRLALGLSGSSHTSLMLLVPSHNIGYSLCANGNGNWYFGKRVTNSFEDKTGDTYLYYGNTTHFSPGTNDTLSLGLDGARWSALYSKVMYFGETSMNRAILAYSSGANKYGIWYNEGTPDTMRFSASGNADTNAGADLCINGNGDGTVTIRGNTILHMGNAWYAKTCSITSSNMSNYPWHRFAYCTTGTAQY